MEFLAVCTFELRDSDAAGYELAYAALRKLGFDHATPANQTEGSELPPDAVVGSFQVCSPIAGSEIAFLRNCLSFKLREVFQRHGLDAEFLLVLSRGDLAWERGGYAAADFAARHGRGALAASVGA
jgi:hypothetical protein